MSHNDLRIITGKKYLLPSFIEAIAHAQKHRDELKRDELKQPLFNNPFYPIYSQLFQQLKDKPVELFLKNPSGSVACDLISTSQTNMWKTLLPMCKLLSQGNQVDIIVDNISECNDLQLNYQYLRTNGFYIVENIGTADVNKWQEYLNARKDMMCQLLELPDKSRLLIIKKVE
jgi:hypothetical protein